MMVEQVKMEIKEVVVVVVRVKLVIQQQIFMVLKVVMV